MSGEITAVTRHSLSAAERHTLADALARIPYPPYGPFAPFVAATRRAVADAITPATARVLDAFKNDRSAPGALIIDGCPFNASIAKGLREDELDHPEHGGAPSEALIVGVTAQIGEPYSVDQEGKGLVNNVCPSRAHLTRHTGLGSRMRLGLHIENAAARAMPGDRAPEGLALIGVSREPGKAPGTAIADGRTALARLDDSKIRELQKPQFVIRVPKRWHAEGTDGQTVTTSVVLGSKEDPRFVAAFYDDMVEATTAAGREALKDFTDALEGVSVEVVVEPGVLVMLDNQIVFHGRGAFEAAFDEDGRPYRWLQRVFWTTSLRRLGTWPFVNDRVVSARAE
jgi:L-asparagine oxygenase